MQQQADAAAPNPSNWNEETKLAGAGEPVTVRDRVKFDRSITCRKRQRKVTKQARVNLLPELELLLQQARCVPLRMTPALLTSGSKNFYTQQWNKPSTHGFVNW